MLPGSSEIPNLDPLGGCADAEPIRRRIIAASARPDKPPPAPKPAAGGQARMRSPDRAAPSEPVKKGKKGRPEDPGNN